MPSLPKLCFGALLLAMALGCGPPAVAAGGGTPAPVPLASGPATAGPAAVVPDPAAWQDVITGQIEAFRKGDAATALSLAAEAFRKSFSDPAVFMVSIAASGYTPIFTSVSHSFGSFSQPDAATVMQVVEFVGPRQELYEAIYALGKEADGWRVQGVELMKKDGISV